MKNSELRTRAKNMSLRIIAACDEMDNRKGRAALINQIIRSSTSVGANIHEAAYGASKADFINKLQIALKECFETEYWIEMLAGCGSMPEETAQDLLREVGVIHRMLVKSITTAKNNKNK